MGALNFYPKRKQMRARKEQNDFEEKRQQLTEATPFKLVIAVNTSWPTE